MFPCISEQKAEEVGPQPKTSVTVFVKKEHPEPVPDLVSLFTDKEDDSSLLVLDLWIWTLSLGWMIPKAMKKIALEQQEMSSG